VTNFEPVYLNRILSLRSDWTALVYRVLLYFVQFIADTLVPERTR